VLGAAAMAWLARIGVHSGYASSLLGPVMVTGIGMGLMYPVAINTGTFGVAQRDVGVASASINTDRRPRQHERSARHAGPLVTSTGGSGPATRKTEELT
jgi:hypothetical protein